MSETTNTSKPRKRFIGKAAATKKKQEDVETSNIEDTAIAVVDKTKKSNRIVNQIPLEILNDPLLSKAIEQLPSNYNFEIHKTVWQIQRSGATRGLIQFEIWK
ncbi:27598_t:CDS:2, partial [Racocetra persica]